MVMNVNYVLNINIYEVKPQNYEIMIDKIVVD